MKRLGLAICFAFAVTTGTAPAARAEEAAAVSAVPTIVENYYRVKWGSLKEFIALYEKNHRPLLDEMRNQGFVKDIKIEYPFLHMAGGPRWDMRVRITFRDATAAIDDPRWDTAWAEARARLYKDLKKFDAEEARRFSILEEHWDVIVKDFPG